jgi:hypothetical protein
MLRTLKSPRRLAAVAVFAIVAMSAFGFAAQNNFNGQNRAGNGTDAISGFNISNIGYSLQDSDPTYLDEVSFDLNQAAGEVQVRFNDGIGWTVWFDTCNTGVNIVCSLPAGAVNTHDAVTLEVSAVS